jgi:leucyl-tRNA synthetase
MVSAKNKQASTKAEGSPSLGFMAFDPAAHHCGGVDLYVGGAEHAVLHLLYARFWHKALFDLGEVSTPEPFGKLFHQGLITSWAYQRADKSLVPVDQVEERSEGQYIETATGATVTPIVAKMSKSLKNVQNPDDVIAEFGADTFRLYEMYMGPLEASKPWNPRDIAGCFRFLQRAWRLVVDEQTGALRLASVADDAIEKQLHRTIAKVASDIERISLNTAIAAMIEFVNAATSAAGLTRDQLERFTVMLSPFAPHVAEELWMLLGHNASIADAPWPRIDEAMLRDDQIELPVQIMGKVRGKITVPADADSASVEKLALADAKIAQLIEGKTVRKVVVVPGKIINIVAN